MVQRSPGRKTYRTANGKHIDLDLLIQRNELTPAVGNMKVNARGDELGPGGKIVRPREEVLRDYYQTSSGVPKEVARKRTIENSQSLTENEINQLKEFDEDWEEDNNGNFVKKGKR